MGCLINRGYVNIHNTLKDVQILLQVHDSLAGQFPSKMRADLLPKIVAIAEIVLPYDDPLVIPVGIQNALQKLGGLWLKN